MCTRGQRSPEVAIVTIDLSNRAAHGQVATAGKELMGLPCVVWCEAVVKLWRCLSHGCTTVGHQTSA